MTEADRLWLRIVAITTLSSVLLIALAPDRPRGRLPWPVACALGTIAGIVLFSVITHNRPRLPAVVASVPLAAGKVAFLGLWAANEEVLWRRVALGELLGVGIVPALVVSTAGFALMHRSRRRVHLATGCMFGTVYLVTGALGASIAAHWVYNLLVGAFLEARPAEATT
jgi:membrane protease YdiL (CAAX protease family)